MAGVSNGVATFISILTGHELIRLPAALMTDSGIARADVSGVAHRRAQETRAIRGTGWPSRWRGRPNSLSDCTSGP